MFKRFHSLFICFDSFSYSFFFFNQNWIFLGVSIVTQQVKNTT